MRRIFVDLAYVLYRGLHTNSFMKNHVYGNVGIYYQYINTVFQLKTTYPDAEIIVVVGFDLDLFGEYANLSGKWESILRKITKCLPVSTLVCKHLSSWSLVGNMFEFKEGDFVLSGSPGFLLIDKLPIMNTVSSAAVKNAIMDFKVEEKLLCDYFSLIGTSQQAPYLLIKGVSGVSEKQIINRLAKYGPVRDWEKDHIKSMDRAEVVFDHGKLKLVYEKVEDQYYRSNTLLGVSADILPVIIDLGLHRWCTSGLSQWVGLTQDDKVNTEIVEIVSNVKNFVFDIDALIAVAKKGDLHNTDVGEYHEILKELTGWKGSIIQQIREIEGVHVDLQISYDSWMAEWHSQAEEAILRERRVQFAEGSRDKVGGAVTSQQIRDWVLKFHKEDYAKLYSAVKRFENDIKLLENLLELLKSRTIEIISLLKLTQIDYKETI